MAKYKQHSFPYIRLGTYPDISNCYLLGFTFPDNAPFIALDSSKKIDEQQAHRRLSELLAVMGLYSKIGFVRRPDGGAGGYFAGGSRQTNSEADCTGSEATTLVHNLSRSDSPFQVQSRFVLSRAYALMTINDSEAAAIEFFKIIELYVKEQAYRQRFITSVNNKILGLASQKPQIFSEEVYTLLVSDFSDDVVEIIKRYIKLRNAFLGHGGVRPEVAQYFGDPEKNMDRLAGGEYLYEGFQISGGDFYERVVYDIEPLTIFVFSKLNGISPKFSSVPGCWYQPDNQLLDMLSTAGLVIEPYDFSDKAFTNCKHIGQ